MLEILFLDHYLPIIVVQSDLAHVVKNDYDVELGEDLETAYFDFGQFYRLGTEIISQLVSLKYGYHRLSARKIKSVLWLAVSQCPNVGSMEEYIVLLTQILVEEVHLVATNQTDHV